MAFWWVNQNQTFQHERGGGYIWSPKRKRNGDRNPFYEYMREVQPGDLVLCFSGGSIRAIGIARTHCHDYPRPDEFGHIGEQWDEFGWRVLVQYHDLANQVRPAEHMDVLANLLPERHSPLHVTGRGLQAIYLTIIDSALMNALCALIGEQAKRLLESHNALENSPSYGAELQLPSIEVVERQLEERVLHDESIAETERASIVMARLGQGKFKDRVHMLEKRCRVTYVERHEHLRASHCKPWRHSNNLERLDGENGLLLTPNIDHLFDKGFIGFERNGLLVISPVAHKESLARMGVPVDGSFNAGSFSSGQQKYLEHHLERVFLKALV